MKSFGRFLRVSGLLLLLVGRTDAALIAYEPFAYPTNTTLGGQSGGGGWSGPWTNSPLIFNRGMISPSSLSFPRLTPAGNRLRTAAPNGTDNRDFRRLDTTNPAVAPWVDTAGKFGKDGTTLWIAFLARLSAGQNSGNGGIHLYDGLGDLTTSADGDKANHERCFMGDRASGANWFFGRTCGGCPCGVFQESAVPVSGTTPADTNAAVTLTNLCAFDFDYVEVGSGSESLDIDEFRIATTYFEAVPVLPPLLAVILTNNIARVRLAGLATQSYFLEAGTNLIDWTNLGSNVTDTNGTFWFDETNTARFPARFYRAYLP